MTRLVDDSLLAARPVVFDLVVVTDPEGNKECDEEEYDVHDGQGEAGLEHGAGLVDMQSQWIIEISAHISERTQAQVDAATLVPEVCAIRVGDAAQLIHGANQSANEAKVDKGNECSTGAGAMVHEESADSPGACKYGDYKEDEDEGGRELVVLGEALHEPREHADDGNERNDFAEAPKGEEHAWNHSERVQRECAALCGG